MKRKQQPIFKPHSASELKRNNTVTGNAQAKAVSTKQVCAREKGAEKSAVQAVGAKQAAACTVKAERTEAVVSSVTAENTAAVASPLSTEQNTAATATKIGQTTAAISATAERTNTAPSMTAEQVAVAESVQKEIDKRQKKATVVNKLTAVWTLLSTVYAIASTCLFIAKGWLGDIASIVLVCILAVYVCVFIVLAVMTFRDVKGGTKRVKTFKKTLKIFKASANIILLSIAAVSMVGMSFEGFDVIAKFIAFIVTFVIAAVQLALGVTQLVMKIIRVQISKKFKVEFVKFVDGKKKKKSVLYKLKESRYKNK